MPSIEENDVTYELPEGWIWCRLGDITSLITSGSRDWAKFYSSKGAIFLRMGNLSKHTYQLRLKSIQHVRHHKMRKAIEQSWKRKIYLSQSLVMSVI